MKSTENVGQEFWCCYNGVLAQFLIAAGMNEKKAKVLGYITEKYFYHNAYKTKKVGVAISLVELMKAAGSKSNSHTTYIVNSLINDGFIECTNGGARKANKYKIANAEILKLQKTKVWG